MNIEPRLGVDFGRVIHGGPLAPGDADTAFLNGSLEEALASPATAGAYDVLPRLIEAWGGLETTPALVIAGA